MDPVYIAVGAAVFAMVPTVLIVLLNRQFKANDEVQKARDTKCTELENKVQALEVKAAQLVSREELQASIDRFNKSVDSLRADIMNALLSRRGDRRK